jgi:NAD(P)-dependent dehydrogenase (short-subunit alcohol dehydrogenase family)
VSTLRVALITGAGSGVGRQSALTLAAANWAVVVAGRRVDPLQATARDALAAGATDALAVPTDVADATAVAALFGQVRERFGRLDLLFNNAGVGAAGKPLEELELAEWQAVVDTNLTAPFVCTQHAFRMMKAQDPRGGRIINNGSVSAHVPRPNSAPYTSTKTGITGLTRATALDGRAFDIACGQIDIGNAGTEMTATMQAGTPLPQADGSKRPEPTIDVQHVANAVLYMAELPLDANVPFITVMATQMPYMGRG